MARSSMNSAPNDDILASQDVNCFDSKNPSDYHINHCLKVGLFVMRNATRNATWSKREPPTGLTTKRFFRVSKSGHTDISSCRHLLDLGAAANRSAIVRRHPMKHLKFELAYFGYCSGGFSNNVSCRRLLDMGPVPIDRPSSGGIP